MSPLSAIKEACLLEVFAFLLVSLLNGVQCNENDLKNSRLMQFLSEPRPQFSHIRPPSPGLFQGPRILSRSDNFPVLSVSPPKFTKSFPLRSPQQPATVQHIMRREQFGNFPTNDQHRYHFDQNQSGRYAHVKDTPILDVGKNQFPQQYVSEQYIQNFKVSPRFNGNIIIKDQKPTYASVQQHAIPVQASQYLHYPKHFGQHGTNFNILPSQQTPIQYDQSFRQDQPSYSVHEESENQPKPGKNHGVNYLQAITPARESKDAQEYLHFMGTNEYFLPKRHPDYKMLDAEHDQQIHQFPLPHHQELPLEPFQHQQPQKHVPFETAGLDNSVSSSYNKPIQVSDLFYQQDPAPANSAAVRGSYQAGQDVFVVKSDGNKAVKHVVSTPLSVQSTTQRPPKSLNLTKSHKSHTQEPLRFEFTEQDAIRGSMKYTHSPPPNNYYYETQTPRKPTETPDSILDIANPLKEYKDDTEDGSDTETAKRPKGPQAPTETSTDAQDYSKDTENYCEKICANVYDENDEIICGSDGYMYTGETQLQCYSSCLNISVSIKSKGSCL